jgi:hypothetical protein
MIKTEKQLRLMGKSRKKCLAFETVGRRCCMGSLLLCVGGKAARTSTNLPTASQLENFFSTNDAHDTA